MFTRQEMWDRLGAVEVLVIGGGITGTGIARDAARRGLKVALVDMSDLAFGTSSRSSKMVHGGLRYLEHFALSLVFESVSERRVLLDIAPHIVNPMAYLAPIYSQSRQKLWIVNAGMWLYEGLSLFRSPKRHQILDPDMVKELEPTLKIEGMSGAPVFFDCSTDDARLTLETGLDAAKAGAVVVTWARMDSFITDDSGRVTGALVEDMTSGEMREVLAEVVINATGPWTDGIIAKTATKKHLLRPTKGVHIVVDRSKLPVNHVVVFQHPVDSRPLFAVPWEERTYLGTTDTDYEGDPAEVFADCEDIDYLIDAAAVLFPDHPLTHDDVLATWAGLRPLIQPEEELKESSVSREHEIVVGEDGLITIAGGKLTTYRRMAAEVVETALSLLRLRNSLPTNLRLANTDTEPLPGAVGWPADDDHGKVAEQVLAAGESSIEADTARHLANCYGMRGIDIAQLAAAEPRLAQRIIEGRPEVYCQVKWAITEELAASITDVLKRRTQIYFRDLDQGLGVLDEVGHFMAEQLQWDEERLNKEKDAYSAEVSASRRWREGQK
ncbi:MAG: glycerol-3-phosphate dehydrogenase/oxidase [Proteobacteria bacterium]|nr:glycerol-3-phosphate dehydrogenase/oxidase [Pseudomonadota bacterium]